MNGSPSGDLDQLGEVLLRLAGVDVGVLVVLEHPERPVDTEVDARRLYVPTPRGVDLDAPVGEGLSDAAVREDHH
jgi:hypothetical protein